MTKKERPKIVYKYRSLEDVNHLRILVTNEIYFPSPSQLNDPFDCGIPFTFWLGSDEKIKEYLTEYRDNNYEKINEKKECECGGKYTHKHKAIHFKTEKHQAYLAGRVV